MNRKDQSHISGFDLSDSREAKILLVNGFFLNDNTPFKSIIEL